MPEIIRKRVSYVGNIYDTQPVGEVIQCERETTPAGYIELTDVRQSVLRSKYPQLFKEIGTTYGAEDDEHFNLPSKIDVNVNETAMLPRVTGEGSTSSEFLDLIANRNKAKSPATFGSWNITDGPGGNAWYNYIYIPHRAGLYSDGNMYGTLLLMNMIDGNRIWLNHYVDGLWRGWE